MTEKAPRGFKSGLDPHTIAEGMKKLGMKPWVPVAEKEAKCGPKVGALLPCGCLEPCGWCAETYGG